MDIKRKWTCSNRNGIQGYGPFIGTQAEFDTWYGGINTDVLGDDPLILEEDCDHGEDYPSLGEQLDAIWKQFAHDQAAGRDLIPEMDEMIDRITAVKIERAKKPKKAKKEKAR